MDYSQIIEKHPNRTFVTVDVTTREVTVLNRQKELLTKTKNTKVAICYDINRNKFIKVLLDNNKLKEVNFDGRDSLPLYNYQLEILLGCFFILMGAFLIISLQEDETEYFIFSLVFITIGLIFIYYAYQLKPLNIQFRKLRQALHKAKPNGKPYTEVGITSTLQNRYTTNKLYDNEDYLFDESIQIFKND